MNASWFQKYANFSRFLLEKLASKITWHEDGDAAERR